MKRARDHRRDHHATERVSETHHLCLSARGWCSVRVVFGGSEYRTFLKHRLARPVHYIFIHDRLNICDVLAGSHQLQRGRNASERARVGIVRERCGRRRSRRDAADERQGASIRWKSSNLSGDAVSPDGVVTGLAADYIELTSILRVSRFYSRCCSRFYQRFYQRFYRRFYRRFYQRFYSAVAEAARRPMHAKARRMPGSRNTMRKNGSHWLSIQALAPNKRYRGNHTRHNEAAPATSEQAPKGPHDEATEGEHRSAGEMPYQAKSQHRIAGHLGFRQGLHLRRPAQEGVRTAAENEECTRDHADDVAEPLHDGGDGGGGWAAAASARFHRIHDG